ESKLIERERIPRVDSDRLPQVRDGLLRTSEPAQEPRAINVSGRESRIEAHRPGQFVQRLFRIFTPGEQRQIVVAERIVRMFPNIPFQLRKPLRPADYGAIATSRIV